MKNTFILFLLAAALPGRAQYVLEGKARNYTEKYIYLQYSDDNNKLFKDSAEVKNGAFRLSGAIKEPTMMVLTAHPNSRSYNDTSTIMLFVEPVKMTISLEGMNFATAKVTGSASQKQYGDMQDKIAAVNKRWKVVFDTLSAVNKRSNFEYQELKNWVLEPHHIEMNEIINTSLWQHPDSYVTAYYLRFKATELSEDTLKKWYAGFSPAVKSSRFGKALNEEIKKKSIGVPGAMAAGFSSNDINGQKLSLSDFRGKYVLLDFWASWCLPCRKGNPHLKELYSKYKDKGFEIIGVSDDDSKPEAWKKAVEKDEIGIWKHVLRGMKRTPEGGFDRSEDKSDAYNIHSLPTKILIGPDGKIIGRYGESGGDEEAMDNQLSKIFN
jgi:thiol-disulfide isomerase/thioredoxin